MENNWEKELEIALLALKEARDAILKIYHGHFDVVMKSDHSPVTLADQNADRIIREIIHHHFPHHAFLTEESEDDLNRLNNDYCWIVDPVDGTKDFVNRDDEFTTNIALAYKHQLVLGVVGIPVSGEIYYAVKGQGAYYISEKGEKERIHVNDKTSELTMLTSRFHVSKEEEEYFNLHRDLITSREAYGSAIKACRIARGLAELQCKFGPGTKEWDTAASQIIVEEAGGAFITPKGEIMQYNRVDVYNHDGFVAVNRLENYIKP